MGAGLRSGWIRKALIGAVAVLFVASPAAGALGGHTVAHVITFHYKPDEQYFVVPAGVTAVTIAADGAQGGRAIRFSGTPGGLGGQSTGTFAVAPGERLVINVGQEGEPGGSDQFPFDQLVKLGHGGWGGGGGGGARLATAGPLGIRTLWVILEGGGGGGTFVYARSAIRQDLLIAAGGGGGSGRSGRGGAGGGSAGEAGQSDARHVSAATGGTQTHGGAGFFDGKAGQASPRSYGHEHEGAGGGGGYFGGGSGRADAGGGGGSGYLGHSAAGGVTRAGIHAGEGLVTISYG